MRYSATKYSVTWKLVTWVRGCSRSRRSSIDHIRLSIGPLVIIALSGTVFELFEVEWYHNLEIWVRGHSISFKPVPFESLGAVSYSPSIVTMALSYTICEIKRDISRKSCVFHTPLHSTPPLGGSPSEYCHPVWDGKTRMVGQPDGEKTLRTCITV